MLCSCTHGSSHNWCPSVLAAIFFPPLLSFSRLFIIVSLRLAEISSGFPSLSWSCKPIPLLILPPSSPPLPLCPSLPGGRSAFCRVSRSFTGCRKEETFPFSIPYTLFLFLCFHLGLPFVGRGSKTNTLRRPNLPKHCQTER